MKITEKIERECCQKRDLKTVENNPKLAFCVHCGQLWRYPEDTIDGPKDYEMKRIRMSDIY